MDAAVQDGGGEALSEKAGRVLCALDDIADPGAKGFEPADARPFFVVRKGGEAYGYVNCCPHLGPTLDWKPDTFLTRDKGHIQCTMHGALFRLDDGMCVYGPCAGRGLGPVAVRVEGGMVVLAADE